MSELVRTLDPIAAGEETQSYKKPAKGKKLVKDPKVKIIQSNLKRMNITVGGTPDGKFGSNTETAVKLFQEHYELPKNKTRLHEFPRPLTADGVVGKNTLLAMDEALVRGWKYKEPEPRIVVNITRIKEWAKKPESENIEIRQGATIASLEVIVDGKVELEDRVMLEAAGPSSQTSNNDDRIYAGTYYVIDNPGAHGIFRLVQKDKSKLADTFGVQPNGRYEVNIHAGNVPSNIEGCFAPGKKWVDMGNYPFVESSGTVLDDLEALIKESNTRKDITTHDGGGNVDENGITRGGTYHGNTFYEEVVVIIKDEIK